MSSSAQVRLAGRARAPRRRPCAVAARWLVVLSALASAAGCRTVALTTLAPARGYLAPTFTGQLPAGLPVPRVPTDNPQTVARRELGRHLFYDRRLSANGTTSCATCHRQELAFTDGLRVAVGSTGQQHHLNTPTLTNVAYSATYGWADPTLHTLEQQATVPMDNQNPVELGWRGSEDEILGRLRADDAYRRLFGRAFPTESEPVRRDNVVRALASFQRALISADSAYDRFVNGDPESLDDSARRGMELFFSEHLGCSSCHAGFNFSGPVVWHRPERAAETPAVEDLFVDNGLARTDFAVEPTGLARRTGSPGDHGRFRAPTLRNVALTAPFMHDGRFETLDQVLAHYARELDRRRDERQRREAMKASPAPAAILPPEDRRHLIAFLEALTDWSFVRDERLSDPFPARATDAFH